MKTRIRLVIALAFAVIGGIMLNNGSPTIAIKWWIGSWNICDNPNFNVGHFLFWPAFGYLCLMGGISWRNRGR